MLKMPRELQFQNTVKNVSIGGLKHSIEATKKTGIPNTPKLFMNSVASEERKIHLI